MEDAVLFGEQWRKWTYLYQYPEIRKVVLRSPLVKSTKKPGRKKGPVRATVEYVVKTNPSFDIEKMLRYLQQEKVMDEFCASDGGVEKNIQFVISEDFEFPSSLTSDVRIGTYQDSGNLNQITWIQLDTLKRHFREARKLIR